MNGIQESVMIAITWVIRPGEVGGVILHVPLLVVILHAFFHIYNYCTKFVNTYNYCFILRCFGFFNVASNFVKRKCVYKFNKILIVFPY